MLKKIFSFFIISFIVSCAYTSDNSADIMEYYAYMSCGKCKVILDGLNKWITGQDRKMKINIYDFNDESNRRRLEELNKTHNIYAEYPVLPLLIFDGKYYSGREEIEGLIKNRNVKPHALIDFSFWLIISAGLLDGINPCVFTIIILLISYLFVNLKSKKLILLSGIFYITAVYITYFLIGLGIFGALKSLSFIPMFSRIFKYILVSFMFFLAILSLIDFIKLAINKDNAGKMLLKLPDFFQNKIRESIRMEFKDYRIIISSVFLGFSVTLLELLCTGGIYFPAIAALTRLERQITGLFYLAIYNISFIIPLIFIFMLVYFGVSSKKIGNFLANKTVYIKLGFVILFVLFGVFTLIF
jgi:cytochrome c biogenesis protein CcdA